MIFVVNGGEKIVISDFSESGGLFIVFGQISVTRNQNECDSAISCGERKQGRMDGLDEWVCGGSFQGGLETG